MEAFGSVGVLSCDLTLMNIQFECSQSLVHFPSNTYTMHSVASGTLSPPFYLTSITTASSWTVHPGLELCCNLGHCRLCFSSNATPTHTRTHHMTCPHKWDLSYLLLGWQDEMAESEWRWELAGATKTGASRNIAGAQTLLAAASFRSYHCWYKRLLKGWTWSWPLGLLWRGSRSECLQLLEGTGNLLTVRKDPIAFNMSSHCRGEKKIEKQ